MQLNVSDWAKNSLDKLRLNQTALHLMSSNIVILLNGDSFLLLLLEIVRSYFYWTHDIKWKWMMFLDNQDVICLMCVLLNPLSANPTKWSHTFKQFADKSWQIVWACLIVLWGWRLKGSVVCLRGVFKALSNI